MSRDHSDYDEIDQEQRELGLAPNRRAGGGPPSAEPARAEFFRAKQRPVLPLLGLVGAVATVATLLWLGRETAPPEALVAPAEPEAAEAPAPAAGDLAPVAAAPDFEVPFPEAGPGTAPVPGSLAAHPADPALGVPSVPSVLDDPAPPGEIAPQQPAPAEAAPVAVAAAHPTPAAPRATRSKVPRSSYSVQLLAARSEAQVGASWDKLRGTHPDLLASLTPSVGRTSGAEGSAFYRLRAGPLPDRASADALCKALSARQQACFVVPPGS